MKILLDTNIVLDVFLKRPIFYVESSEIFDLIINKKIAGCLSAITVPTVSYLTEKYADRKTANKGVDILLTHFDIAVVDKEILIRAQRLIYDDYEDGVIIESARSENVEAIITRDVKGFKNSDITILSPTLFLDFYKHT